MTAFTSTDIPSNINTLEKLHAWSGLALARCNPTAKVLESANGDPVRIVEVVTIKDDVGIYRLVVRTALPLDPNYAESTVKLWELIQDIDNVGIPSAFKSN